VAEISPILSARPLDVADLSAGSLGEGGIV